MELKVFHRPWVMYCSLEEQFEIIAAEGYDSIEANLPEKEDFQKFRKLLDEYKFDYICDIRSSPDDHAGSFEKMLEDAAELNPLKVNSQSGRDFWDFDTQRKFFDRILKFEEKFPFMVCHETHRMRCTFTPWSTVKLLEQYPDMPLTADISHWYCVTETLLEDFTSDMERIMKNVHHVHCRVGYKEGPQVPHPGAPEYEQELLSHEHWWRLNIRERLKSGEKVLTCTPEYNYTGNRYIHTLPFTDVPVADGRKVCIWGMERFRKMFKDEVDSL